MSVIIHDPMFEQKVRADRDAMMPNNRDEVWDGVLVMAPLPNNEHQRLVMRFAEALSANVDWKHGDQVFPGANVSDREVGWVNNYRAPDVVVCLAGSIARDAGTHWIGGPDLVVEIVSPGEDALAKFNFYAGVGTREVMIVERDPWAVELYQLRGTVLYPAGRSDLINPTPLTSGVLPLSFQLRDGTPRPTILVTHTATGQTWEV